MTSYDMGSTRRAQVMLRALVVLLLVGTVLSSVVFERAVDAAQRTRFENQAARLDVALADRMTAYEQVLRGGVGLFAASRRVSREAWATYVSTLRLEDRYPGLRSLSFAKAVPTGDLAAFQEAARAVIPPTPDGRPYTVRAPAGASGSPSLHGPILYVAPETESTRSVLGVDMMLEPSRRSAMQRAAQTGQAVASPRLRLSGSTDDEAGFIVYLPVVKGGRLRGWLTAAFLAEAFTNGLEEARATTLDVEILDGPGDDAGLLHSTRGVDARGAPLALTGTEDAAFTSTSQVPVPGGSWQVRYVAPDGFVPWWASWAPWLVALLGLALTVGVVLLARASDRWRHVAVVLDRQSSVLRAARAEAEDATLVTASFLATMSHEIRTPLNAMLGANSVLMETPLNGEQAAYAAMIRDGGAHLLHVVNEVLDLSKAESGRLVLEHAPFDLDRCVAIVLDLIGTEARRREVMVSVVQDAPSHLVGDVARLRQVLLNLMSNAVKFTPAGGRVTLHVSARQLPDAHRVTFEVADTGIGISRSQLDRLFQPYVQADASITRTHGGTGLGLSIAQRLVVAMGGEITVESVVGQGTTFRFTVVLPEAGSRPPVPQPGETPAPLPRPALVADGVLRVLVAEDDEVNRELLVHMVELLGHVVDQVGDGETALTAVRSSTYDVVLLDRHMPGIDGREVARRIRRLGPDRPLLVAVSGSDGGFGDLVDDEVAKPFVLADLAAALDRLTAPPRTAELS